MPSIHDAFPSNYLKASDLGESRVPVTISHLTLENIGDDEGKPVLYFQGKTKGLVLNKTNANTIVEITGDDDYSNWSGVTLCLYATTTEYRGKTVPCIRVAPSQSQKNGKKTPPRPDKGDPDVPF
jgi:hypothetical protein